LGNVAKVTLEENRVHLIEVGSVVVVACYEILELTCYVDEFVSERHLNVFEE